jgi:hypothetical protein
MPIGEGCKLMFARQSLAQVQIHAFDQQRGRASAATSLRSRIADGRSDETDVLSNDDVSLPELLAQLRAQQVGLDE